LGANCFINAAANAITRNGGFKNFFADDHGEALVAAGIRASRERYLGVANHGAVFVGVTDTTTRMKSVFLGKHIRQ